MISSTPMGPQPNSHGTSANTPKFKLVADVAMKRYWCYIALQPAKSDIKQLNGGEETMVGIINNLRKSWAFKDLRGV